MRARDMLLDKNCGMATTGDGVRSAVRSAVPMVLLLLALTSKQVHSSESSRTFSESVLVVGDRPQQQQQDYQDQRASVVEGWGLPDGTATVGRLFEYRLPARDATGGIFTEYKVTAAGEQRLPDWLAFDESASAIEGVPDRDSADRIHNIQVAAVCRFADGRVLPVQEFFTIKVSGKDDSSVVSGDGALGYAPLKQMSTEGNAGVRLVRCRPDASVTTATVVVDADESSLPARERVDLIRNLCSHLGLPVQLVRLAPLEERHVIDASALVAGPGDVKQQSHAGLVVQWDVGCGNVYADHMPVLELLEVTSGNGTMGAAVGRGIVGWHITNRKLHQQLNPRRLKRQLSGNPTATVMPTASRPAERPGPTMTVPTDAPGTRIVPTTASKVKDEMTATADVVKPTRPRPTKSPAPPVIIPTRTGRWTTSPIGGIQTPSSFIPTDELEPSIGPTEKTVRIGSTEALPRWTTARFTEPSASVAVIPPVIDSTLVTLSATSVKTLTPKISRRTSKTPRPDGAKPTPPPIVIKKLLPVDAVAGNLLLFKIPNDVFTDSTDGGSTDQLKLLLLDKEDLEVERSSWIKLNSSSRTLYGLPLEEDVGDHVFKLAAIDAQVEIAKTSFSVAVQPRPAQHKVSHEFVVTFDLEHDKVLKDLDTKVNLINKIAGAFGDKDASKITTTRLWSGSVNLAWTNNTLPSEPCPEKEIRALTRYLLKPDGTINETFAKVMEPYKILRAETKTLGSCSRLPTGPKSSTPASTVKALPTEGDVKLHPQQGGIPLLYIIIPVLVFVFLLLLVIIVCLICQKKRKRRQKEQDKLNGLHKGIPIIFADELEDKPDTPASTLRSRNLASGPGAAGTGDEKQPPVPPPEYPRSKPASQTSTLRSDYKSPLLSDEDDDEAAQASAAATLPRKNNIHQQQHQADSERTTTTPLLHTTA